MIQLRSLFFTALLSFALVAPAASQSTDVVGDLSLHVHGGISSDPQGFDVLRETTFGSATAFGGGLTYVIYENVAIRGDFHYAPKMGREECCSVLAPGDGQGVMLPANPGSISEDVALNRYYYGASLLVRFPIDKATPYLKLGGGFVDIRRDAPSYQYDFAEFGVQLGGGISIPMGEDAPVAFFVDAVEWIYARTGSGEGSQYDTVVSAGISYSFLR